MARYRNQVRIIADVLSTARDTDMDGRGVGVTILLRKGNLSYTRMTKMLSELVGSGLLVELEAGRASRYRISDDGLRFLDTYRSFEDFAGSFGLIL